MNIHRRLDTISLTVDLPPKELLLELKGDAAKYQAEKSGVYLLQPKIIDGFHCWTFRDYEKEGIRWNNKFNEFWVGPMTGNSSGINGPIQNQEHPNKIKAGWRYVNWKEDKWVTASSSDVVFKKWTSNEGKLHILQFHSNTFLYSFDFRHHS